MDALHVSGLGCGPMQSSLHLPKVSARALSYLSQHVLRKHFAAAKSDPFVYQLEDYVLTLLADRRHVFHLDNELAAVKICSHLFARTPQLGCPRRDELALQYQQATSAVIDERDLQHWRFPNAGDKGNKRAKPEDVQSNEFSVMDWRGLAVESQRCSKHN
jgi:hypothetical protein